MIKNISDEQLSLLLEMNGVVDIDYNPTIDKILSMSEDEVSRIDIDTISDYIVMLGQYLIFLDNTYSKQRYRYTMLSNQFDLEVAKYSKDIKRGTKDEKLAEILEQYPEILESKQVVDESKALCMLLENKTSVVLEYLNTLKRKQDKLMVEYSNLYASNK